MSTLPCPERKSWIHSLVCSFCNCAVYSANARVSHSEFCEQAANGKLAHRPIVPGEKDRVSAGGCDSLYEISIESYSGVGNFQCVRMPIARNADGSRPKSLGSAGSHKSTVRAKLRVMVWSLGEIGQPRSEPALRNHPRSVPRRSFLPPCVWPDFPSRKEF